MRHDGRVMKEAEHAKSPSDRFGAERAGTYRDDAAVPGDADFEGSLVVTLRSYRDAIREGRVRGLPALAEFVLRAAADWIEERAEADLERAVAVAEPPDGSHVLDCPKCGHRGPAGEVEHFDLGAVVGLSARLPHA